MAGFLRVVAGSPQCDIFGLRYSRGPSLQQLKCFISLRCWAWTHKNQNLMTVVTVGQTGRCADGLPGAGALDQADLFWAWLHLSQGV